MLLLNVLILIFAAFQSIEAGKARIVGGDNIPIARVPHLMQILRDGKFHCGGSLIAPKIVLTAAHCVDSIYNRKYSVLGGSPFRTFGKRIEVAKTFMAPLYNSTTKDWDVAVLILESEMKGKDIETIELCDARIPLGAEVQVSGWGKVSESEMESINLRSVKIHTLPHATCAASYAPEIKVTENMICANAKGKDACTGDSGGALVYDGKICGIVSSGFGCGRVRYPGLYADVLKLMPFIEHFMDVYDN